MAQSTKVMKNSVALMGGRIYHAAVNLFAIGLIARYLKLEGFGEYGFIMAVCSIFMVITDMGIHRIGIRELSRDLSKANDIFWASCFVKFFFSFITFGCIVLTINFLTNDKGILSATYICAVAVILFFLGDIFSAIFIAFERMGYIALSTFVQITTYLLFIIVFVWLDLGLNGIFFALLLSYLSRILWGLFITRIVFFKPKPSFNLSMCIYLIKEGFPVGINRILRKTSFRIDTILIKIMRTLTEVGIYHGAYRIILVLMLIPQSLTEALFPMISRLATESKEALGSALERSFKFLLVMVIPLFMMLIFFSKDIILLILGDSFLKAIPALMLFGVVWGVMFFNDLLGKFLIASDNQLMLTRAIAICLGVNVCMDIILIYVFGYFGAIIATLLAEICLFMAAYYFISQHIACISWEKVLPKPILCGICMFGAIYGLNSISRILALLVGLGIFFISLFIFKTFEEHEIAMLKENFQRAGRRFGCLSAR